MRLRPEGWAMVGKPVQCKNGHHAPDDHKFCGECGEPAREVSEGASSEGWSALSPRARTGVIVAFIVVGLAIIAGVAVGSAKGGASSAPSNGSSASLNNSDGGDGSGVYSASTDPTGQDYISNRDYNVAQGIMGVNLQGNRVIDLAKALLDRVYNSPTWSAHTWTTNQVDFAVANPQSPLVQSMCNLWNQNTGAGDNGSSLTSAEVVWMQNYWGEKLAATTSGSQAPVVVNPPPC